MSPDPSAAQVIAEETSSPIERASGFPSIQRGEHVLERLAAAGYAVVKLPEAIGTLSGGELVYYGNLVGVPGVCVWFNGDDWSPGEARDLAGALLAAAQAAEAGR